MLCFLICSNFLFAVIMFLLPLITVLLFLVRKFSKLTHSVMLWTKYFLVYFPVYLLNLYLGISGTLTYLSSSILSIARPFLNFDWLLKEYLWIWVNFGLVSFWSVCWWIPLLISFNFNSSDWVIFFNFS